MGDRVIVEQNLHGYFREALVGVCEDGSQGISPLQEHYLVNLLADFAARVGDDLPGSRALALMYQEAMACELDDDRAQHFKELGDEALFVAGIFADSIERSVVDLDYYIQMGGFAYASLGAAPTFRFRARADLFVQMGQNFMFLVEILNQVAERVQIPTVEASSMVVLLERYQRTGSERLARRLREQGIWPLGLHPDKT